MEFYGFRSNHVNGMRNCFLFVQGQVYHSQPVFVFYDLQLPTLIVENFGENLAVHSSVGNLHGSKSKVLW
jgi:hypothetical protein